MILAVGPLPASDSEDPIPKGRLVLVLVPRTSAAKREAEMVKEFLLQCVQLTELPIDPVWS